MVKYDMKEEPMELLKDESYKEHREMVKQNIENQRIIINGETIDYENFSNSDMDANLTPNIFMVFNSHDEMEPHDFIHRDPLFLNGLVKDWHI